MLSAEGSRRDQSHTGWFGLRADKLVQHSVLSERKPISLRDVGGIEEDSPATLPASARPQSASSRQTQSECFWARLGVLACACAYGTSFVAVKMLDVVLTPAVSAFLRFGLAACFSLPILARARETISPCEERTQLLRGSVVIGCVNGAGYIFQSIGLQTVEASLSSFVCSLSIVVVPVLDAVVLRKPLSRAAALSASLAACGVALLSLGIRAPAAVLVVTAADHHHPEEMLLITQVVSSSRSAVGLLATLFQPLCFGYGFWATERLLHDAGAKLPGAPLAVAAAQLVTVCGCANLWLLAVLLCADPGASPLAKPGLFAALFTTPVALAVVWTGLGTTFCTVLVETLALSKITARESTVLFSTEPLWGSAFAALVLGEQLSRTAVFGGTCVVAACVASSTKSDSQPHALADTLEQEGDPDLEQTQHLIESTLERAE